MTLRIQLFGPLSLAGDEAGLTPRLRLRAQRLLVFLLLHRQAALDRETVAFRLWPDQLETEALSSLRRALSDLRAALPASAGQDWILVEHDDLRWNDAADYWLDVAEFERLMAAGTSEALHGAAELCSDDLLPGWGDEWLAGERGRLGQMRLDALRRLATHYRALGDLEQAQQFAQRALALDPLAEAGQRELMALHYAAGDRAAALAQYAQFRAQLWDEIGVEPMPETQALTAAIRRGEPLPAPPQAPAPRAGQPSPVGRDLETARLNDCWDQAVHGKGRLVIVSGEAGVGKSRLVAAAAERAARHGGLCLVGQSYEFENVLPYQAIVEMLRSAAALIRRVELAAAHRSMLARLAPDVLGAVGRLPSETTLVQDDQRGLLFEALLQTFVALARTRPLLLLFEDVHWAAGSTLDWLTFVTPRLNTNSILIVITYRTGEIDAQHALARLEQRFAHEGAVSTLGLRPLSREANQELVAQFSGLEPGAIGPIADRLFAETGGNPFFLSEMVRGLIEAGQIVLDGGHWSGRFTEAAGAELPLPESLRLTINARVERLTEMTRAFLQAAAVAGRVFQYGVVQHAGGWSDPLALEALDQAIARGFVREHQPSGAFGFAHHLVQEAVYAALSAPRRAYWHRRLAEVMEVVQPDEYESLAHHWAQAGEQTRASTFFLKAGDRARALIALTDAAVHYQAAEVRWPSADPIGRAEALYKLGQCQWVIMETHQALRSLEAARGLFESLNERKWVGDTERLIGRAHWELGDMAAAWPHYRRALAILEQEGETVEWARAISSISQMHMLASEFDQSLEWGERALALGQRLGAEDVIVHALNNIGASLTHIAVRDPQQGLALLRESRERADALGSPHDACRAYINLGEGLVGLSRYAEARAVYEEQLAYATRVQARAFMGAAVVMLSTVDWVTGRWRDALARHAQIVEIARGPWEIWAGTYFGRVNNDLGQSQAAIRSLEALKERALKWTEMQTVIPHMGQLARAYAAAGMSPEAGVAVELCRALMERSVYLHPECLSVLLAGCQWYLEQRRSLEGARACLTLLERADGQMRTLETRAALTEARGLLSMAEGTPGSAAEHLRQAAAGWEAIGRPYDRARALRRLGMALAVGGERDAAGAAFGQARRTVQSLAEQLDDPELRSSFLESALVREIRAHLKL